MSYELGVLQALHHVESVLEGARRDLDVSWVISAAARLYKVEPVAVTQALLVKLIARDRARAALAADPGGVD